MCCLLPVRQTSPGLSWSLSCDCALGFPGSQPQRRPERQQQQLGGAQRAAERGQDVGTLALPGALLGRGAHA